MGAHFILLMSCHYCTQHKRKIKEENKVLNSLKKRNVMLQDKYNNLMKIKDDNLDFFKSALEGEMDHYNSRFDKLQRQLVGKRPFEFLYNIYFQQSITDPITYFTIDPDIDYMESKY